MAKQSGLHQIKGKVGEHSYYRQTGIASGLIRSINQGLSARVKTDAAYANTRLNNVEFGGACNVAGLLGGIVTPKFRPMVLPFSQSNMAKKILELVKATTGNWGQRSVTTADTEQLADILSATSKRNPDEFLTMSVSPSGTGDVSCNVEWTQEQAALMASLGIDAMAIKFAQYDVATGKYNAVEFKVASGYTRARSYLVYDEVIDPTQDYTGSEDLATSQFTPLPIFSAHQIIVAVVTPIRVINGQNHILQEYCSFKAWKSPAVFS